MSTDFFLVSHQICDLNTKKYSKFFVQWDALTLFLGHWTCNLQVAGSSPCWPPLRTGLGQATYACVPLVTKQYNLVPAKEQ